MVSSGRRKFIIRRFDNVMPRKNALPQAKSSMVTGSLGITQSSGLDRLSGYPDNLSKKVQVNEKSDPLARRSEVEQSEKQGAPSSPETAEIYQRLIGQYSQIVNADCFGTLAQIETKMQQCTAFLENWMTALGNKEFVWSIVK